MYAVVKTGGKQYRVSPGDVLVVEKLLGDAGDKIKLDQVMIIGEDGKAPEVGRPLLDKAAVNCEVLDQARAGKILVFKKKRRQGYKRTKGHRQDQTVLHVLDINGKAAVTSRMDAKKPAAQKEPAKADADGPAKAETQPAKSAAPAKKKAAASKKTAAPAKKKAAAKKKATAKKKTTAAKKKT